MSIDTRSGEHGEALNVMAALKKTLGPQGIMNPGKMTEVALELARKRAALGTP